MKKEIHPTYQIAKVHCSCGHTFEVGSTSKEIRVDVCSKCHPFYTGKAHLVDTEGRVDKFKAKLEKAKKMKEKRLEKKAEKKVELVDLKAGLSGQKKEKKTSKGGKKGTKSSKKDLREIAQEA